MARYLSLLLLRPGIWFCPCALSSLDLSLELAELLPGNNSAFYERYNFLINLIITFCCCVFFQVSWRSVFWGLGIQFCIGLFVIRTQPGLIAFEWLGHQIRVFGHQSRPR